jgi:Flp pilus assembly protein TadG
MNRAPRTQRDERGITLVLTALLMVSLMALSGLAVDGGNAYIHARQVQNAADAASLAATRKLFAELYSTADANDAAGTILATAETVATDNSATVAASDCEIVGEPTVTGGTPPELAACPTVGSTDVANLPAGAAGVLVTARSTSPTTFMQAVGIKLFANAALASALIETATVPVGAEPLMMCAVASSDPNSQGDGVTQGTDLGSYGSPAAERSVAPRPSTAPPTSTGSGTRSGSPPAAASPAAA